MRTTIDSSEVGRYADDDITSLVPPPSQNDSVKKTRRQRINDSFSYEVSGTERMNGSVRLETYRAVAELVRRHEPYHVVGLSPVAS